MSADERYAEARIAVTRARARAAETGQEIRTRLAPRTIARGAWRKARDGGEEAAASAATIVRAHPRAAAGAGVAALALALRGPIARGAKRLIAWRRNADDEE